MKRVIKGLLVIGLVMVLCGAAAFFLASFDKHPKDHTRMVRLEAI